MYRTLHKQRKERALDLFADIKKNITRLGLNGDDYHYILPYGHFGEYAYILGHLPSLKEHHKICLVVPENKEWLTRYFPNSYDFVIPIPDAFLDLYEELFQISYLAPGHPYVAWTDIIANGRFNSELLKYGRITLAESYAFALEQPLNASLTPLSIDNLVQSPKENRQRPCSNPIKKFTLIMPSAITIKPLPPTYWFDLFQFLVEMGLNPIIDSTFIEWDVAHIPTIKLIKDELINFVANEVDEIIGLRSGMLDLLGGLTKTMSLKIAALYPVDSEHFSHSDPGHSVRGYSKGGINLARCWGSNKILDIEVSNSFKKESEGKELKKFLAPSLKEKLLSHRQSIF